MTLYELLLFIHIAATVVWLGAGFFSLVLATGYDADGDELALLRFMKDQERLALKLFVPASFVVVLMGIALVVESEAWSFDQLWIVLGLAGFVATFLTGVLVMKPGTEQLGAEMQAAGGRLTPEIQNGIAKLMVKARVDYIVLTLVVFDMVVKPTGDDALVLVVMAAALVAGIGYIVTRLRAIDARGAATMPASAS